MKKKKHQADIVNRGFMSIFVGYTGGASLLYILENHGEIATNFFGAFGIMLFACSIAWFQLRFFFSLINIERRKQ